MNKGIIKGYEALLLAITSPKELTAEEALEAIEEQNEQK